MIAGQSISGSSHVRYTATFPPPPLYRLTSLFVVSLSAAPPSPPAPAEKDDGLKNPGDYEDLCKKVKGQSALVETVVFPSCAFL